ncbi:MAG: diacylglycerol kinase family lipid kinase [Anaerolineae bacterium]|nr:diacylglycerol kinase family lipid kinase [Anaerolineae bacterium]
MKAQLIYNPAAGPRDVSEDLDKVIDMLRSHGWQVSLRQTLGPGDAVTYAREAVAEGCEIAVAVGGDGTLGEVASGLAGSECALGVLPVGTGNVWAHMLGLPIWTPLYRSALMDAALVLLKGERRCIDLGRTGERYFVLWAGVGFDAQIAYEVEPHREIRRSLGNFTYVIAALVTSLRLRGSRVTVSIDGKAFRQRVLLILVTNAQLYGHSWRLAPQAQLDDGLLEVYIFKGDNTLDAIRHFILLLLGEHHRDPHVEHYQAHTVEIRGEKPLPVHLDGDPSGYTPLHIEIAPQALWVIVPSWTSGSLFRGGKEEEQLSLAQRIAERLRYERERWHKEEARLREGLGRHLRSKGE